MSVSLREFWKMVLAYLGPGARARAVRIAGPEDLRQFLQTRATHVAQTSLYGYLRTRAGTRSFELFSNDDFVHLMNAAKWNVWLACFSDLAIYAGGLVAGGNHARDPAVGKLIGQMVDATLNDTGVPGEADSHFPELAAALRRRIAFCAWHRVPDDETAFSESPAALVRWAPIMPELKELDADIVRNSVRFRWQEVRRELRGAIDAAALLESAGQSQSQDRTAPR